MAIRFSGLASGLDTENMIKELMKAERLRVDRVKKDKTKLEWKKDVWEDMNKKLYEFYTKQVFNLKSKGTFMKKSAAVSSDAITVSANTNSPKGVHEVSVQEVARGAHLTSKAFPDVNYSAELGAESTITLYDGYEERDITLEADCTIDQFVSKINDAGLNIQASFDRTNGRIFMNTTKTGERSHIVISGINDPEETQFLSFMGLEADGTGRISTGDLTDIHGNAVTKTQYDSGGGVMVDYGFSGQDAEYTYNGIAYTSDSNEVSINGLNITINTKHVDAIDINITQDTDAIYDNVKEFINAYNALLLDLDEKLDAETARGYEPLTAEEKESMSDDEVELWEQKIKDSLLRRDATLSSIQSSVRNIIGSSQGVDTSSFEYHYLSDLGIVTGDYQEKGVLHINGDEEDPLYAAKTNYLKEAIEDNPEDVAELLNSLGDKLYSTLQEKMKSTKLSSALTFFNDKDIDSRITDYEDQVSSLEEKLMDIEDRYYRQFTAMEQAIQQMNNQSASLASMLGGGQ